jgi:hypothetical protein
MGCLEFGASDSHPEWTRRSYGRGVLSYSVLSRCRRDNGGVGAHVGSSRGEFHAFRSVRMLTLCTLFYFTVSLISLNRLYRDAIDLKVLTGVRKACFSCYERIAETIKNSSSTSSLVLFESQHTGAIVQVAFFSAIYTYTYSLSTYNLALGRVIGSYWGTRKYCGVTICHHR